jgi:hypothetical protein
MDRLQAPPPSKRHGLTASQWLYREYLVAKRNHSSTQVKAAKRAIVLICKLACGRLRPQWHPPSTREGYALIHPYATFWTNAWRNRIDFAEKFVNGEVKRGMTSEEARYIGRRCKLRLIDEVRRDTGFDKVRQQRLRQRLRQHGDDEFLQALNEVRHLAPAPQDDLWLRIKECKTRREASNTTIAREWNRSEGWVRKLRKRLATRLWSIADSEQRKALGVLKLKPICDGV